MDTISGEKMIRELARLGALGSLPRGDLDTRVKLAKKFSKENIPCLYAVGLKNGMDEAKQLIKNGAQLLVIDVSHGGSLPAQALALEI